MVQPPPAGNRLQSETSPYLLQHAANPVDWYPWGEEALMRARSENKPILLSIGYSACHWCHVMAHESFEDPETAAVMNELFVNIKVDREERPDLDKVYQLAHQLLTRRPGGWPLTVFLDPDRHLPFFAGTYFPNTPRFNLPAFTHVLRRVAHYYRERSGDLLANQQALRTVLEGMAEDGGATATTMDESVLIRAEDVLAESFDPVWGGFGQAPKFPHTSDLAWLLARATAARHGTPRNLNIVRHTLKAMALGGLYDHLGGGFFRYSVDAHWGIPHFEKMLYDNGPLLALYADAWQVTRDPLFRRVAEETAAWVLREMQADHGGFYSSLDADSEGVEGKYYVWDRAEIAAELSEADARLTGAAFGLEATPNFEHRWHLYRAKSDAELAQQFGCGRDHVDEVVRRARQKLLARREGRVRPGRDEKVLVAWNALMVRGMARAGRILGQPSWVAAAYRAFDFLKSHCWHEGRLRAAWKDGRAPLNAYLDDHVMLIDAALELLQAVWRSDVLMWATALADLTLRYFEDRHAGGFFFTSSDHEELIHRPKPLSDESLPSGNGIAVSALWRLGLLIGDGRYVAAAERAMRASMPALQRYPAAHGALLESLHQCLEPPPLVILRGEHSDLAEWLTSLSGMNRGLVFSIPADVGALPGRLEQCRPMPSGAPVAYVCMGRRCLPPLATLEALEAALSGA